MRRYFIDSNVIVYANDSAAGDKQERAIDLVARLIREGCGSISVQVFQEYANVALSKLKQEPDVVLRQIRVLETLSIVIPSVSLVRRQVEIRQTYGISFWDAGIVAAAEEGRCDAILSEDLSDRQFYAGVRVCNPFQAGFAL